MYYYGFFRNTDTAEDDKGQLYKVTIVTEEDYTEKVELLLSSSPFIVEYENDEANIYKPYKCSTATVSFYQNRVNYAINSSSANKVTVKLLKYIGKTEEDFEELAAIEADDIYFKEEWVGYATPNSYSQPFENELDLFELECQDGLSTLKYKEYKPTTEKGIISFANIIKQGLKELKGLYKAFFIPDTLVTESIEEQDILSALYISEYNFLDEDKKGMTYLEVIEQICLFLGLTCVPTGNCIYFIDYKGIANGYNDYYKFYWDSDKEFTRYDGKEYKQHHLNITASNFSGTGTNISLGSTYNKVKVTSDLYPIKELVTKLEDYTNWEYSENLDFIGIGNSFDTNVVEADEVATRINSHTIGGNQVVFIRFKNFSQEDKNIRTYWYNKDDIKLGNVMQPVTEEQTRINKEKLWNYDYIQNYIGACVAEYGVKAVKDFNEPINDVDFKEAVFISQPIYRNKQVDFSEWDRSNYIPYLNGGQKIISYKTEFVSLGNENYIILDGKLKGFATDKCLPIDEGVNWVSEIDLAFVWAKLRFGSRFWNGKEWVVEDEVAPDVRFKLPLSFEHGKNAVGTEFSFSNTVLWNMNTSSKGYAVPSPIKDNAIYTEDIEFTLYRPFLTSCDYAWLTLFTDFSIKVITNDKKLNINEKDKENNTSYTNTIDTEAVEEFDEIELKITTWDKKSLNYSSVYYTDFLETAASGSSLVNDKKRLLYFFNRANGNIQRAEEHLVGNIVKQYSSPTSRLELSLRASDGLLPYSTLGYRYFEDKVFVVDRMNVDYGNNKNTVSLVDIKL